MKKISLLLALLFGFETVSAQELCGTAEPEQHVYDYLESIPFALRKASRASDTLLQVPIQIHMIRSDAGIAPLSPADIFAAICTMNDRYQNANIRFYIKGAPLYYDSTALLNPPSSSAINNLMGIANQPYVMNIYFANLGAIGLNGYAFYPNSGPGTSIRRGGLVMSYSATMNGATLSHETGHYLSLPHPFSGTSNNKLMGERVTRNFNEVSPRFPANCYTAGDRFCDTEADFRGSRWGCAFIPTAGDTDINSDFFRIDSSLLMSYAGDACRVRLTEEQMIACRDVLQDNGQRGYIVVFPPPVQTAITTAPVLRLPVEGANDLHPNFTTFRWDSVPGATMYRLRAWSNNVVLDLDTLLYQNSYFHGHNKLKANRPYQWEVIAYNETDYCGNPPSIRGNFSTVSFTPTSVEALAFDELKVYPNLLQAGESFTLEATDLAGKNLQIQLRTAAGKLVDSRQILAEENKLSLTLPFGASGIYFLSIESAGYRVIKKIFVQ